MATIQDIGREISIHAVLHGRGVKNYKGDRLWREEVEALKFVIKDYSADINHIKKRHRQEQREELRPLKKALDNARRRLAIAQRAVDELLRLTKPQRMRV